MAFLYKAYQFSTKTHLWDLFNDGTGTLKLQFEDWSEYIGSTIGGNVIGWEWLIWLIWWNVIGWSQRCWMIIKSYSETYPKSSTYIYAFSRLYLEGFPFIPCQQEGNPSAAWQIGSEPTPDSSDSTIPKLTQKLLKLQAVPSSTKTKTPTFFFPCCFSAPKKTKTRLLCVCVSFLFSKHVFWVWTTQVHMASGLTKQQTQRETGCFFLVRALFWMSDRKKPWHWRLGKTLFWWDLVTRRNF